jgi:hypothetical protein
MLGNTGATKIDELGETSVCSTKGEVINDGNETKSKARVSKMAKVWPALLINNRTTPLVINLLLC